MLLCTSLSQAVSSNSIQFHHPSPVVVAIRLFPFFGLSGTTMLVFDVISLRGRGGSEVCVDDLIEELTSGMPESLLKIILISEP